MENYLDNDGNIYASDMECSECGEISVIMRVDEIKQENGTILQVCKACGFGNTIIRPTLSFSPKNGDVLFNFTKN